MKTFKAKILFILFSFIASLFFFSTAFSKQNEQVDPKVMEDFVKAQKAMISTSKTVAEYLLKNQNKIVGIEYIAAASTGRDIGSSFGHSMLRFVDSDGLYGNDIVVSFEALVTSPNYTLKEGIMGGYSVFPHFDILSNFWSRYVREQNRPLHRYIIPSTKEQRIELIQSLYHYSDNPSELGSYTFFNRNCAGVLSQILIDVGFTDNKKRLSGRVPVLEKNWLAKGFLSPYAELIAHSPYPILEKLKKVLGLNRETAVNRYKNWPANALDLMLEQMSREELLFIYQELWDMPYAISSGISAKYNYRNGQSSFSEMIGMATIPSSLYQSCNDAQCGSKALSLEKKIWGEVKQQEQMKKRFDIYFKNAFYDNGTESWSRFQKRKLENTEGLNHTLSLIEASGTCTKYELLNDIEKCF